MSDARICLERRRLDGTWEQHTAWYEPKHRDHLERNLRGQATWDPNNAYRIAEENPAA
jgi:hypothetical protein